MPVNNGHTFISFRIFQKIQIYVYQIYVEILHPPPYIKSNFYAGKLFAKIILHAGFIQKLPDNRGNVKPGIHILTRLRSCLPKAVADFFEQVPPAVFAAKLFQDSCGPAGNPVFSPLPS